MPDIKISQLPVATTPLTGTEELPLVQGGVTSKATAQDIADLGGGGGFAVPTLSVTPALPAWAALAYRYPIGIDIDGVSTPITTFGLDINNIGDVVNYYYSSGYGTPWTAFSTTAEAVTSNLLGFYNYADISVVSMSLPTVKAIISTGPGYPYDSLFIGNPNFTTVSLPNLVACGGVNFSSVLSSLTSLDLSSLRFTQGFGDGLYSFNSGMQVPTLSFPSLTTMTNNINISESGAGIVSLSLPSLASVGGTTISITFLDPSTTGLNLNSLELIPSVSTFTITMTGLTSFGLPALRVINNSGITMNFNTSLNQTSVDNILIRLAALDGTLNTTNFTSGTVNIAGSNAAPSGAGYAAVATLTGRGVTVSTN
jgi:hypothetical protein